MTPLRPVAGVIVYVIRQFPGEQKVLFLHRSGGLHKDAWWPVAGTPELNESPQTTAERELFEETGLRPERMFDFGSEIPHADQGKALATFVVYVDDTPVVLNYEHSDYRWMTGAEAVNQVPDHSKQYLDYLRDHFIEGTPAAELEITRPTGQD